MDTTTHTYDNIAAEFATKNWEIHLERELDRFASHLPAQAKILDLGCGPGRDIGHLQQRGFRTIGADLSFGMLQEAIRRVQATSIQCDMRRLSIADGSFDGVWLCASLLHLRRDQALGALLEARRVLHSGAPLFVAVQRGAGEGWQLKKEPRFFTYYQSDELAALVTKAGFAVDASWENATQYAVWIDLVALAG